MYVYILCEWVCAKVSFNEGNNQNKEYVRWLMILYNIVCKLLKSKRLKEDVFKLSGLHYGMYTLYTHQNILNMCLNKSDYIYILCECECFSEHTIWLCV